MPGADHVDGPAMQLRESLDKRQTEPQPSDRCLRRLSCFRERLDRASHGFTRRAPHRVAEAVGAEWVESNFGSRTVNVVP